MPNNSHRHYAVVVKPVGSSCNLCCDYCYYLNKESGNSSGIMSYDVLENYIRQIISIHGKMAEIEFAWHGGEPTIAGIPFYQKALELQKKYGHNRKILNTLQTNGTLINDEWCRFFAENNFRIGISIDGPEHIHNVYRKDSFGKGTFSKIMEAVNLFQKHSVQYNTLTTVNAANSNYGKDIYEFLRTISVFMQFLPVVECINTENKLTIPPGIDTPPIVKAREFAPFNVSAEGYGKFLCEVFDLWLKKDLGKRFVQIIESTVGNLTRRPAGLCVHESVCGHCAVVEKSGDVYRCDRFVFDQYRIGNIMHNNLEQMMESNRAFGEYKLESLPTECLHCSVANLCFGGCPKDRILEQMTIYGVERKNYLCKGYKQFFQHVKSSGIV